MSTRLAADERFRLTVLNISQMQNIDADTRVKLLSKASQDYEIGLFHF